MAATDAALSPDITVGVIGAGTMGRGIARVAAQAGHAVVIFDSDVDVTSGALTSIRERLMRDAQQGRLTGGDAQAIFGQISGAGSIDELGAAGMVIEAIVEDLEAKHAVFRRLDAVTDAATIFASNTSSLSVRAIAAATDRPDRFGGMHFFNPAPVMPLVEVVATPDTNESTTATLAATSRAWGKTPVVCTDTPGFIVNRVARSFYLEPLLMLENSDVEPARLDAAVRAAGFPMGPFELLDLIGLDVNLAVSRSVHAQLGADPRIPPSHLQREMVAAGRLGRKTGAGFYPYPQGAPVVDRHEPGPFTSVRVIGDLGHGTGLADRLVTALSIEHDAGAPAGIMIDGHLVAPSPTGSEAAAGFDLVADWSEATAVGAWGDTATLKRFAGVCAAVGVEVIRLPQQTPTPVLRTVAMMVAMAAEAAAAGVATPDDIDTALRLGLRHPHGPFEWRHIIGEMAIDETLRRLAARHDAHRYRRIPA